LTDNKNKIFILLLSATFVLMFSYHKHSYDNENTRLDLAYSIVIRNTLNIDPYHENTIDKAYFEGHYYCDKAPGLSFFAVPFIYAGKMLFPDFEWHPDNPVLRYYIVIVTLVIPTIICLFLLWRIVFFLTGENLVFPLFAYSLSSLALPYSTLFYDHQFTSNLMIIVFYLWLSSERSGKHVSLYKGLMSGFLLGYISISEYPAAIPAIVFAAFLFFRVKSKGYKVCILAGFIVPLLLFASYNNAAFGHPLRIGYFYESNEWFRNEMGKGLGGVTYPSLSSAVKLLFEPHKGYFFSQPFLLLAIPGAYIALKQKSLLKTSVMLMIIFILIRFLINISYYEPYGGFSPGPRFIVGTIPFMIIISSVAWNKLSPYLKGIAGGVALFCAADFVIINIVEPHIPPVFKGPLFHYVIPLLNSGYTLNTELDIWRGLFIPVFFVLFAGIYLLCSEISSESLFDKASSTLAGFLILFIVFMSSAFLIEPDNGASSYYIGYAFNRNKQYSTAATYFRASLNERDDVAKTWYGLGIAELKSENYNEAVRCFEKTVEIDPYDVKSNLSLAASYIIVGKPDMAKQTIEKCLEVNPGRPALLNLMNVINEMSKKNER